MNILRHHSRCVLPLAAGLLLAGCFPGSNGGYQENASSAWSSSSSTAAAVSSIRETRNVTYRGRIEEAGISIYQQGSHRLMLEDGRFMLLESDTVDLNAYVGSDAEVFGHLRPTVEAGGIIMRVERIRSLTASSSEPSSGASSSSASAPSSSAEATVASSSEAQTLRSSLSSWTAPSSTAASSALSDPSPSDSAQMEARIALMAQANMALGEWKQRYCSDHIGFCIPVHRNWWFKSFGTTTSYLWHVEIGPEELFNLGDGPIHVNLVSGGVGAQRAVDGQVRVENGMAIGFREWTDNRHFQIRADARLESAVRVITSQLASAGS